VTSNCLVFVLERWHARGGFVVAMHSLYGWWPHFVWSPDLVHFEEFAPTSKYARWCPPLFFTGRIQHWIVGDGPRLVPYTPADGGPYPRDAGS